MESKSRILAKPIRFLEVVAQPVEISRCRSQHSRHQVSGIASARPRPKDLTLVEQVFELQEELGRIMACDMKRKGLGENTLVGAAILGDFETDFACVKSQGEAKRQLQPLDAKFEPRKSRGEFGRQLQNPNASVLAGLVVVLDGPREINHSRRGRLRPWPPLGSYVQPVTQ